MWQKRLEEYQKQNCIESKRLSRDFFTRDGITVAKELLGKVLVHETTLGKVRAIITETESYMGVEDKASHTYGGRRTQRTEPMFHIGGTSYVYFTYGMYYCMNITSSAEDIPQAVLLRGLIPADKESQERMLTLRMAVALEKAQKRKSLKGECIDEAERKRLENNTLKHLADGPGKMCIAMHITKADNDLDMVKSDTFYVTEGIQIEPDEIHAGKRIGIDYAEEARDYLWRFYLN